MRKLLSILMLICLLCGMVVPVAAEGETALPELFVENNGKYVTELTIPKDLTRAVYFYTRVGEDYTVADAPAAEDNTFIKINREENPLTIEGKSVGATKLALRDADGNTASTSVTVKIPESKLEIRKKGGTWSTSLSGIQANEEVEVELRLGADSVYDDCIGMSEPSTGLMRQTDIISAEAAGTYTLSYKGYSVSVTVDPEPTTNEISISSADLSKLSDQTKFNEFLTDNHYSGSGDLTLVLPSGSVSSVTCSVVLPDNAILTLQGATDGTTMTGLKIDGGNVDVSGITFTGAPGISLKNIAKCAVSNCKFSRLPFQIQKSESGEAPTLALNGNVFTGIEFATVLDHLGNEVGKWLADPKSKPEIAYLNLGVTIGEYIADSKVQALSFNIDSSVNAVIEEKWVMNFLLPCSFDSAYIARNGVKGTGSKSGSQYKVLISESGQYAVISGSYPKIANGQVVLRAVDAEYLWPVTVDTTFSGATVTHNSKQVPAWINNKKLSFQHNGAGTYKVATATTKTTTKTTTTTSRKYTTSTQDYFLVTPAGFSNAVRGVKDNLVTIDCTQAGQKSISLPVASMAAAAEKGYDVLVKTKNAELTLDSAALKSLSQQAKGTTVLLNYKSLNHKTLTSVGQASLDSHLAQNPNHCADLAFLVTATSDSETIEDLQKGTITLKIPFIVLPGTEDMENVVYALQGETVTDARETTVADGYLTAKLLDLTEHMVFQIGESVETTGEAVEATGETAVETTVETTDEMTQPETEEFTEDYGFEEEEEESSFPIWIPIVVVVLLLAGGGAAVWFLYLRKRFKK